MNENNLANAIARLAAQDADLVSQEQTQDIIRQRNALLREIQEILKEIKAAASTQVGA